MLSCVAPLNGPTGFPTRAGTSRSRSASCRTRCRWSAPGRARRTRRIRDRERGRRCAAARRRACSPPPSITPRNSRDSARRSSRIRTAQRMSLRHALGWSPGGFAAAPRPACRARRAGRSSPFFATAASGLSGATSRTRCHAFSAPSRSCLANARTMPTFSSVFECFGSIARDLSNWASARSGWFE